MISKQVNKDGEGEEKRGHFHRDKPEGVNSVDELAWRSREGRGGLGTVERRWRQRRGEMPHGKMTYISSPREAKEMGQTTPLIDWQRVGLSFTIHSHSSTRTPRAECSTAQYDLPT